MTESELTEKIKALWRAKPGVVVWTSVALRRSMCIGCVESSMIARIKGFHNERCYNNR